MQLKSLSFLNENRWLEPQLFDSDLFSPFANLMHTVQAPNRKYNILMVVIVTSCILVFIISDSSHQQIIFPMAISDKTTQNHNEYEHKHHSLSMHILLTNSF